MIILTFLKSYWREIGCALAVLFSVLFFRAQGALGECQASSSTKTESLSTSQAQTSTAKASIRVIYKTVAGQPCAQIETETIVEAQNTQNQAQNTSVTASTGVQNGSAGHSGGLFVGGGYLGAPYAQIGIQIGIFQAYGVSKGTEHGGGAAVRVLSW